MKKWNVLKVVIFGAVVLLMGACEEKETPYFESPQVYDIIFTSDGKSVKYNYSGLEYVDAPAIVAVNTNRQWTVETKSSWVHVNKTGETFSVSVDKYDIADKQYRLANVSIVADGANLHNITVKQEATLNTSFKREVNFEIKGGSSRISIQTSHGVSWNATSDQAWLQVTKTADNIALTAGENTTSKERTAEVTIRSESFSPMTIQVKQDGPWVRVSPMGPIVFSADGKTLKKDGVPLSGDFFKISTNTTYTAKISTNVNWIVIGTLTVGGILEGFHAIGTSNNKTTPHKSGNITVTAGNLPPVVIPVSQEPLP